MASLKSAAARHEQARFSSLNCILSSLKGTCTHIATPDGQLTHVFTYPRASLLGLPTEIRLQIYAHLASSLHCHIDLPLTRTPALCYRSAREHTLRLCSAPDATFGQLCTRPVFSGLHSKEALCGAQPPSSSDPFALRGTCRTIYAETSGILEKSRIGVTLEAEYTPGVLKILPRGQLGALTRLTIVHASRTWAYSDMHSTVAWLRDYAVLLPSLRSLAVQTPVPHYKFCVKRPGSKMFPLFAPAQTWHKIWFVKALHEAFAGKVSVILEAWVVVRAGYRENQSAVDEMVVMRGIAWGNKHVEKKGDVEFEVLKRQKVVEVEEKAQWKSWWTNHELGYGRKPS